MIPRPTCSDSRNCFAKRQRTDNPDIYGCTILSDTAGYSDSKCPFCKPFRSYTNEKYYPFNEQRAAARYRINGYITIRDAGNKWVVSEKKIKDAISSGYISGVKEVNGIIYIPEKLKKPDVLCERRFR